jgi:hypothetical protein
MPNGSGIGFVIGQRRTVAYRDRFQYGTDDVQPAVRRLGFVIGHRRTVACAPTS